MYEPVRNMSRRQRELRKSRLEAALAEAVLRTTMFRREMVENRLDVKRIKDVVVLYHSRDDAWCWDTRDEVGECCIIGIADWLLLDMDQKHVDETIVHELVHAVRGTGDGHGEEFLRVGRFCEKLFGYKVEAYRSDELERKMLYAGVIPYVVECPECGCYHEWWRAGREVKDLLAGKKGHTCPKCGTPFVLNRKLSRMLDE